jgi:hypothetical protein
MERMRHGINEKASLAYLSELFHLKLSLSSIFVVFDGAEQQIDLGYNDLGQRVGSRRAARAWACAGTEGSRVGWVRRVTWARV